MDEKEVLDSEAKITSISISVKTWGDLKGEYEGVIKFEVSDDTVEMKLNHEFCKILLTNSYKQLKYIIQVSGVQLIKDILNTKTPISKSKKELKDEEESNKDSD